VALAHFTNHDIRRTVRSRLSRLKGISLETREAILPTPSPACSGSMTCMNIWTRSAKPWSCGPVRCERSCNRYPLLWWRYDGKHNQIAFIFPAVAPTTLASSRGSL
jgi:hypothetical protein